MVKRIHYSALLNALAPRSCCFCGDLCRDEEQAICALCYDELPWRVSAAVMPPFVRCVAPLQYEFPVDAAIKAFKFRHQLHLASAFSDILCAALPQLASTVDAVVPVPLHWARKARRGFNQAEELATPVARRLGVPLLRSFRRTRSTVSQSSLTANARDKNVRDAFRTRRPTTARHVLIVDDIVTTGATCRALAKTLRGAGCKEVSVLAIAKV